MQYSYLFIALICIHFVCSVCGQQRNETDCPNYSYRCPQCEDGQFCAYPSGHGCEGNVGVPICQSVCHGIVCGARALPCPDECPFLCQYHGTPCCPFLGVPTCLPPCNTLRPCDETPCPNDCKDDCFYLNADTCCPKGGKPVCRSELRNNGQHGKLLRRTEDTQYKRTPDNSSSTTSPLSIPTLSDTEKNDHAICVDMIVPCPPECPNNCEYPTDVPCPLTHPPKCRSTTNADQVGNTAIKTFDELLNELTDIMVLQGKLTMQMKQLLEHGQNWLQWINSQRSSRADNKASHPSTMTSMPSSL